MKNAKLVGGILGLLAIGAAVKAAIFTVKAGTACLCIGGICYIAYKIASSGNKE